MVTPETIRTSLQQGEWITSIDFKDAYFHIPIQEQSRKYLRFHIQGQTYQFKALPFGLSTAPLEFTVRPTPDRWQSLPEKIQALLLLPACPVRQFMSLIGLLTATEKHVHLGRLHMRPIQWHLKNNWRVPESLEKIIPLPRSLHPHLQWWLEESNVLQGQPLHPIKHALQIFNRRIKRRVGRSLKRAHCKRVLVSAGKQTTHKLPGTKSSLFGFERVPRPMH